MEPSYNWSNNPHSQCGQCRFESGRFYQRFLDEFVEIVLNTLLDNGIRKTEYVFSLFRTEGPSPSRIAV